MGALSVSLHRCAIFLAKNWMEPGLPSLFTEPRENAVRPGRSRYGAERKRSSALTRRLHPLLHRTRRRLRRGPPRTRLRCHRPRDRPRLRPRRHRPGPRDRRHPRPRDHRDRDRHRERPWEPRGAPCSHLPRPGTGAGAASVRARTRGALSRIIVFDLVLVLGV
jgi:hypothetical protein